MYEQTIQPLNRLRNVGIENLEMSYEDGSSALFYNGLLCGFIFFDTMSIVNHYKIFKNKYGKVYREDLSYFDPEYSLPAETFVKAYGKTAMKYLQNAIEYSTLEEKTMSLKEENFNWELEVKKAGNLYTDELLDSLEKYAKNVGIDRDAAQDFVLDAVVHVFGRLRYYGYVSPDRNTLVRMGYK